MNNIDNIPFYTKPENNITMFLMMLFSGFIFVLLFSSFVFVFSKYFSLKINFWDVIKESFGGGEKEEKFIHFGFFFISLISLYSFGFVNFLLSYILVTLPSYNLFVFMHKDFNRSNCLCLVCLGKIFNLRTLCYIITLGWVYRFFSKKEYSFLCDKVIKSWIMESTNEDVKREWEEVLNYHNPAYKIGLLYFYSRTLPSKLSYEIKVLFQQLMLARTCLSSLVLSLFLAVLYCVFMKTDSSFPYEIVFLSYFVFVLVIAIYCICIRFFDKTLYGVFMLSKVPSKIN